MLLKSVALIAVYFMRRMLLIFMSGESDFPAYRGTIEQNWIRIMYGDGHMLTDKFIANKWYSIWLALISESYDNDPMLRMFRVLANFVRDYVYPPLIPEKAASLHGNMSKDHLDISNWNRSEDGCRGYKLLPDGRAVLVFEDNPFYYRLVVTGKYSYVFYDNVYCYTNRDIALQEMDKWDGSRENEPNGWVKNPTYGRNGMQEEIERNCKSMELMFGDLPALEENMYLHRFELSYSDEMLWTMHYAETSLACISPLYAKLSIYIREMFSVVLMQRAMNG